MSERREIEVPDIGDFSDVDVVEVLVSPGDLVEPEAPLVTLETDKASLDVPSPAAGRIASVAITAGDTVSQGDVIAVLEVQAGSRPQADGGSDFKRKDDTPTKIHKVTVQGEPGETVTYTIGSIAGNKRARGEIEVTF